jgi:tRNA-specific 2-thiouridylase
MSKGKATVVVAMSGGVDSSAAATALVDEGFHVIGVTFRMWEDGASANGAGAGMRCSPAVVEAASQTARELGIEHNTVDLRELFHSRVVEPFAREYVRGRTPNPCVECNRLVKFPALVEVADALGADIVATGHYARACLSESGRFSLLRASFPDKDQSYALYGLEREHLSRCVFPNGERSKEEVRKAALSRGVSAADRGESQEICFLCGGDYRDFISRRYPEALSPGPILDTSGRELGEHRGIAFYTVGQRRGLGVSAPYPMYVVALDPLRGAVILGGREEVPGSWLRTEVSHWMGGEPPAVSFEAEAMVRYNSNPARCGVEVSESGFEIIFEAKAWALTPGQHAVLFRGDEVLGGGVIAEAG